MKLNNWLRKTPQPAYVLADGKRVELGAAGSKWSDVERTIEAVGATKIEAYKHDGTLLRAMSIADESEDKSAPVASVVHTDPETARLSHFATLLADAYDRGANSVFKAFAGVLEENNKLIKMLADRLSASDASAQRLLQNNARMITDLARAHAELDSAPEAGEEPSVMNLLAAAAAQQMMGGAPAVPPNGAPPTRQPRRNHEADR